MVCAGWMVGQEFALLYFSGTLKGGWMGENSEFFGEVFGLFLVFCLFHYYINHIHAWRAVLRVHNVEINF
jgi:hypothetical protein